VFLSHLFIFLPNFTSIILVELCVCMWIYVLKLIVWLNRNQNLRISIGQEALKKDLREF